MRDEGEQPPPARLVLEFRQRLKDLRVEVGNPSGAQLIRAVKHAKGPRLRPSTLSEFANDKRPTSLPGQDFVHAYVRACLRHRGDAPDEIERQVYSWLASRTGIVVALGTSVTSVEERAPQIANPLPDPNLICDPAELGDALLRMIAATSRDPSWLAEGLGLRPSTFEDLLSGRSLPSSDQWDELMSLLSVDKAELPQWRSAYERVDHHAARCTAATAHIRSRGPLIVAVAAVLLLVGFVGIYPWLSSDHAALTAEGSPCPHGGPGFTVLNHHSSMLVNNQDKPRLGLQRGVTEIGVKYEAVTPHDEHKTCLITLRATTSSGSQCLTADAATDIVWRPCADDLPTQQWIQEPHWHDGTVHWERLHSAPEPDGCLQQARSGGVGTPLTLVACSTDWMQQWRLLPPTPLR